MVTAVSVILVLAVWSVMGRWIPGDQLQCGGTKTFDVIQLAVNHLPKSVIGSEPFAVVEKVCFVVQREVAAHEVIEMPFIFRPIVGNNV